jgi:hypothetical protein
MADSTVLRRHCGPQGGAHCAWTRTMRHAASSSSSVHLVVPNFCRTHVAVVAAHQTRQLHAGALRPPLARSRVVSAPHTVLARTCLQPARTHTCMCERCSSCVLVTAGPLHTCVSEHLPALTHMHAVAMHGTCHMAGRVGSSRAGAFIIEHMNVRMNPPTSWFFFNSSLAHVPLFSILASGPWRTAENG